MFEALQDMETDFKMNPVVHVTSEEIVKVLGATNIEQVDKNIEGIGTMR